MEQYIRDFIQREDLELTPSQIEDVVNAIPDIFLDINNDTISEFYRINYNAHCGFENCQNMATYIYASGHMCNNHIDYKYYVRKHITHKPKTRKEVVINIAARILELRCHAQFKDGLKYKPDKGHVTAIHYAASHLSALDMPPPPPTPRLTRFQMFKRKLTSPFVATWDRESLFTRCKNRIKNAFPCFNTSVEEEIPQITSPEYIPGELYTEDGCNFYVNEKMEKYYYDEEGNIFYYDNCFNEYYK